jgi:hypothetical protein
MPSVLSRPIPPSRFYKYTARPDKDDNLGVQYQQVLHETGYHVRTLEHMWDKYSHVLHKRQRTVWRTEEYFYLAYVYIHMYPTLAQSPRVLWTPESFDTLKGRGYLKGCVREQLFATIIDLAAVVDEVHWCDRLQWDNHVAYMPCGVTGAVDTAPIFVSQPTKSRDSTHLFQPK